MIHKLFKILIFLLIFLTANLYAVNIYNIRTATTAEKTRIVLDLSNRASYLLFSFSNPDRLVLDIKNAGLDKHFDKVSINQNKFIKSQRIRIEKNYVRFILYLKQPVVANSFILPADSHGKYRLVIDIKANMNILALPLPLTPKRKITMAIPVVKTAKPFKTEPKTMEPIPPVRGRNIIVVIDPGHGGKDPGTTSYDNVHEKNIVLSIAKYLQDDLNRQPGFHAVLTRTSDYYITLRGRLDIARQDKADMFVAVHADAYPNSNEMGASVFALSERGATSEAARWLAEKENNSELLGGASLPDNDNVLRSVLIDLSQTNTISESLQIGSSVLSELAKVTALHHPRVEQAAFVVLKSPDIPSILVETGFLSTPAQEYELVNPIYQRKIANALSNGIVSYFLRNPPQDTQLALQKN